MEEGLHAEAEGFIVAVDRCPGGGFAPSSRAPDAGQDGTDHLVADQEQRSDGASRIWGDPVAPGSSWFVEHLLAAELAQVVGGLAGAVVTVGLPGHGVDLGGELGGGEAVGCHRKGEDTGEGGADPRLVQVDAADPGGTELGRRRQLVEGLVGQEADVDAVEHGGEPVDHAGEPSDDLGELREDPAAAE